MRSDTAGRTPGNRRDPVLREVRRAKRASGGLGKNVYSFPSLNPIAYTPQTS